ncbi:T9SS type A sorting domain-containing protein [Flavobacteriaceae bacterium LMO-SS05]
MKQFYILTILIILTTINLSAQNIETFEDETDNATTFTNNGQSFTIESGVNEDFSINTDSDYYGYYGWNASTNSNDIKFIDNITNTASNDGCSFAIKTTDGNDIRINSFYLFIGIDEYSLLTNETLTLEGKRDGNSVYTIIKTSGFADNYDANGYTYIDLSTENGVDNSAINIDELVLSSTATADYLGLDYLVWSAASLSTADFEENRSVKLFPNPSSEFIQLSGLNETETYKIYNVLGSEVVSGSVSNHEKIDIKNLTNGLYFLKFENGNTFKFVKQ